MDNLLKHLLYSKVLGELHEVCRYTSTSIYSNSRLHSMLWERRVFKVKVP